VKINLLHVTLFTFDIDLLLTLLLDQVTMAAAPPPPLPKYPPPKAPPPATNAAVTVPITQARDENDYIEPQMVFDNMFDSDKPFADKVC
jgi:hypothetical protein